MRTTGPVCLEFSEVRLEVPCPGNPLRVSEPRILVTLVSSVPDITAHSPAPKKSRDPKSKNAPGKQELVPPLGVVFNFQE